MTTMRRSALVLGALAATLALGACASAHKTDTASAYKTPPAGEDKMSFGKIFGGGAKKSTVTEQAGIGVNAYLWRASLDTISFMPLTSADPWGGVIISDWYANPQKPDERFKTTIYILDSRLRADALNVSVYKQVQVNGNWQDADVSQQTQLDIENAILTRARELRLSNVKN